MKTTPDENQIEDMFINIHLSPGNRFYRRMKKAAWTPVAIARRRAYIVTGLTVALVAALLTFTPQGRAWAQEVIRFFTRAESDTLPYTPEPLVWVGVTPSVLPPTPTPMAAFAADCGDFNNPSCTFEQIRRKVNFSIVELSTIPHGMHFVGATGNPDLVEIFYDNGQNGWGLSIAEQPWTGSSDLTQLKIGASAAVETVQIGSATGEYVKGGFVPSADGTTQIWEVNAGAQTLQWVDHGVFFSMGEYGPAAILDKAEFVALAESLTSGPVPASLTIIPATETPVPGPITYNGITYNLSLPQAREQAGFDLMEPKQLPDILSFAGASYQQEDHIVRMFYLEKNPGLPNNYGLTVSEQFGPTGKDCKLCGIVTGDYEDLLKAKGGMVVGADAVIESVKIGDFKGEYVEGYWMPTSTYFSWVSLPFVKTLRWQANGMAYELQYSSYSINNNVPMGKADLIRISESMK